MCASRSHPASRLSLPLILFVDDFEDARDLYAEYFVFRGFRVAISSNGADAVAKARELAPAVVVMDLRMPGMDGFEATRLLKSDARTATIPVVALTAHAFVDAEARATRAGCDDVITKPCLPEELLVRVEKILKERHHRKSQPA
jgi:two-component system cell cycle response regulator DivK